MLVSSHVGRAKPGTRSIAGRTTMSPEPAWNFVTSRASRRRWTNGLRPLRFHRMSWSRTSTSSPAFAIASNIR